MMITEAEEHKVLKNNNLLKDSSQDRSQQARSHYRTQERRFCNKSQTS